MREWYLVGKQNTELRLRPLLLQVHWMTRYVEPGRQIDHYGGYATKYPGDPKPVGEGSPDFPKRNRWAQSSGPSGTDM